MNILDCYARQSKIKKPLLLLCIALLFAFGAYWAYLAITLNFHLGDYLFVGFVYCMFAGWVPIWFEVKPTQEEIAAECDRLLKMLNERKEEIAGMDKT